MLYVVLPPTTFFNLAAADIDADIGFGVVLALIAVILAAALAYVVDRSPAPRAAVPGR